jgi:hypothetical protein
MPSPDHFPIYGFPEECHKFDQRHPQWNEMMTNLVKALDIAFTRTQMMDNNADRFVYFFGRVILEDFMEIVLVSCHGYGVAAQKLVRSMYEFTVTLHYLHEHPEESETFLNYHAIQENKLANRLIETFGETILPADLIAQIRGNAAAVKQDFTEPECDHPDAKLKLRHIWSKLDFVSMAKTTGELGKLVVPGYFLPLRHSHPTFGGFTERLEIVDGTMMLKPDSQPEIVDRSLRTAHNCIINMLDVQKEHFKLAELEEPIQTCLRDFLRIWAPDSPLLKD